MDVKGKLVELLNEAFFNYRNGNGDGYIPINFADHLIANGVTVQEERRWISVTERLPKKPTKCLVYTKRGEYDGYEITYYNEGFYLQYSDVTHWMPLPEPPKEDAK